MTILLRSSFCLLMIAGCGSGSSSSGGGSSAEEEDLHRYEGAFHPSEFDPPPAVALKERPAVRAESTVTPVQSTAAPIPDLVPGFRVQIFSSTDIDEANAVKTTAEERFPDHRFYVVYEPPAYKVRAGDFQQRYDADRMARILREGGYSDSWIVPDRVLSNPPPRPAEEGGAREPQR